MNPKVGVFHPTTQHSYQTAFAFQESGQLRWHATPVYYDPARFPYSLEKVLPENLADRFRRQMRRRYLPELNADLVRQGGMSPWAEILGNALGVDAFVKRASKNSVRDLGKRVIKLLEREPVDVLWGYDTASLDVFRWAKPRGIFCVLDRTTIDSRLQNKIIAGELSRHPDYFSTPWMPKSEARLAEEEEEIALADKVIVGSSYCAKTLIESGCPERKIVVAGYGYDSTLFPQILPTHQPVRNRPLNLIYAGRVSPLKGMVYLLEAFLKLPAEKVKLTLLGSLMIPANIFSKYSERVTHISAVPKREVAEYLGSADCLIFPSLFEGSSIVLKEAYGAGLGCLQTPIAGDGIVPEVNGEYIASSSVEDIVEKVSGLIDRPDVVEEWRSQTWQRRGEHTWSVYRDKIRQEVAKAFT